MKYFFLTIVLGVVLLTGCSQSSEIGMTLTDETITIEIDSTFTVKGSTIANSHVQSRTVSQLIGEIDAPVFGKIHSDFVAQFLPSVDIDTTNVTAADIDSVKMFLQMERTAFVGDSLAPLGLEVYRLRTPLADVMYTDDEHPQYNKADLMSCATYIASTMNEPDSVQSMSRLYVELPLDVEFARELWRVYKQDPSKFVDPDRFAREVFNGVYVKSSYGAGRISDFTVNSIRYFYHKTETTTSSTGGDSTYIERYYGDYFAVTPEMMVNSFVDYEPAQDLRDMIAAGDQVLAAPAGYEMEIELPAQELVTAYRRHSGKLQVLNALDVLIPADSIPNKYGIAPPPYVLMVLKHKKDDFFANNRLTDNKLSFYAAYSAASGGYVFTMRNYMDYLLNLDEITAEDYTFVITPVEVEVEASSSNSYYYYGGSSYVVSRIVPYVSKPAMARVSLSKAKIKLSYSTGDGKIL